jgi:hypothetical protein
VGGQQNERSASGATPNLVTTDDEFSAALTGARSNSGSIPTAPKRPPPWAHVWQPGLWPSDFGRASNESYFGNRRNPPYRCSRVALVGRARFRHASGLCPASRQIYDRSSARDFSRIESRQLRSLRSEFRPTSSVADPHRDWTYPALPSKHPLNLFCRRKVFKGIPKQPESLSEIDFVERRINSLQMIACL